MKITLNQSPQPLKIIFFGTSEIGLPILEGLIEKHEVVAIVTSPDKPVGRKQILSPSPIAALAEEKNIPAFKPKKVKNNPEFLEQLKDLTNNKKVDIFIVVSYGKILPAELLTIPRLQTINVHFSLLPKYRGPAPVQFALLNGETTTGITIFLLDEKVDNGPILYTLKMNIAPNDTNITLQNKLAEQAREILLQAIRLYSTASIKLQEQDHDQATFTKIISKEDGLIDWTVTSDEIYNKFRAFQPWPGIYTTWNDKKLKILDCIPVKNSESASDQTLKPGRVKGKIIGCGHKTALELITVQLEGKNPVNIKDFLNGHSNFSESNLL